MTTIPKIKSTLGRSYNVLGDDVRSAKTGFNALGYYRIPEFGLTPYPDTPLFEGMERFQKDHGLKVDGIMKPGGQTERTFRARLGLENAPDSAAAVSSVVAVQDTVAINRSVVAS